MVVRIGQGCSMPPDLEVIDLTAVRSELDEMVATRLDFAFTELEDRRYARLSRRELELITAG